MQFRRWLSGCLILMWIVGVVSVAPALADEIVIGGQCDRTGPTKPVGIQICPGVLDYVKLVNKKGGVNGHKLNYIEVEHAYKVDRGVEAYERLKRDGAVAMLDYGTPIVYALTPRHMEDKITGLTPGFGRADSTDGERFPISSPWLPHIGRRLGQPCNSSRTKAPRRVRRSPISSTITRLGANLCRSSIVFAARGI